MHITPNQIQAYAAQRLAALRRRGAEHLQQAQARRGDVRNLTLGSMVDTLADEANGLARTAADLCSLAGSQSAAAAILSDLASTEQTLMQQGLDCRMASTQPWPPAVRAIHAQVTQ